MNNLLIIDTASATTSVAFSNGKNLLVETEAADRRAAQATLPMVAKILQQADLAISQLDAIAVVTGPGSFTGIRIGIGIAQGLCLANDIAALPLSTLAWNAQSARRQFGAANYVVVIPARNEELYVGLYQAADAGVVLLGREQVGEPRQLLPATGGSEVSWTGLSAAPQPWSELALGMSISITENRDMAAPALADLVDLAHHALQQGRQVQAAALMPNYVKDNMQYG